MFKKRSLIIVMCFLIMSTILYGCSKTTIENTPQVTQNKVENTHEPVEEIEIESEPEQELSLEMVTNGDFSLGYKDWYMFTQGASSEFLESDGTALIPVKRTGSVEWAVQPYHDSIQLSNGCTYTLTFDIKATVSRTAKIRIQKNGSPYTGYLEEIIQVNEEFQTFSFTFEMDNPTDPACRMVFNLGKFEDEVLEPHEVEIDNVSLMLDDGIPDSFEINDSDIPSIHINQVGYKSDDRKIVAFADIANSSLEFKVVSSQGEVVFSSNIGEAVEDENSGEIVSIGDFSSVNTPGTYHIEVDGHENSYDFTIANDVYNNAFNAVIKMFYYQRCGCELTEEYAGDFAHGQCHMNKATIYGTDQTLDVSGGWHDAGDFGRYVTPASKAVIDLLLAYESYPDNFTDDIGIPESGNGIPDILDEVKYELEFLLKMQDAQTGGVYHKVTPEVFADTVMPDKTYDPLILSPISAVATGDLAAIMAKAYTIYLDIDKDFAISCLNSSELAWQWLENNPDEHGFENPEEIKTGEYKDYTSKDERLWAAAELYSATGNQKYHKFLKTAEIRTGMGWKKIGMYGVFAYLSVPEDMLDDELYDNMLFALMDEADQLYLNSQSDMYQLSLLGKDYVWGSNMNVANNAMILLIASKYNDNQDYIDVAFEHLNYLMGKNALARSYITGYGTNTVERPHHRVTESVGHVFDGLVIGGPNANLQDPYAQTLLKGRAPAKCYADSEQSFSTNEITIYWNSPVVYLLNYFK